ncbi:MAG: DUF4097 family beta strand repeat-containing protein [Gemmatimonadota bacterium]|nr:DUF4097 family beta strand repeat-containing protein [Gemmatimonadota bacterium]
MKPVCILIAISGLCLLPVGCDAGKSVEKEVVERSVEFLPEGRLTIVNVNGDISVSSWDRNEVKMTALKRARAESEEAARSLLEKTTVQFDRTEEGIDIRTDAPKKPGRNRNVSVAYTVTVPREIDLELKTVNGSVDVENVSGAVDAKTANGRIGLTGIVGAIQARTTNGEIGLLEVLGTINAKTANGSIKAEVGGSGEQQHEIRAATTNGGIEVTLPKGLKANLKASTVNGKINTDFPVTVTVKGLISKSVDGVINGGGELIHLKTVNGSIRLKER